MKVGVVRYWRWPVAVIGLMVLLAGYALGLWWLDRWALAVAPDSYLAWQPVFANAAVGMLLMALLAALTRRVLFSVTVVALLSGMLMWVAATKVELLGIPLILQDLYFIRQLDLASLGLLFEYVETSWYALGAALLVVTLLIAMFRLEVPWCARWGWARGGVLVAVLALLVSLQWMAWPWNAGWYDKAQVRPSRLNQLEGALHAGMFGNILYVHSVQRQQQFTIDEAALRTTLARLHAQPSDEVQVASNDTMKPDIVMVLSESFMDPRAMHGMGKVQDVVPTMRRLMAAGQAGWLRVPTFGGGTVRTEFEALTGMPVEAFPDVYYPYMDIVRAQMPGIVDALKAQGYGTLAVHGNTGAFWNRTNTYMTMGMDRFITRRDFKSRGFTRDGTWYADAAMTEIVLQELAEAAQPMFVFAASIQVHGPYAGKREVAHPERREALELPKRLTAVEREEFRNYLYHLQEADRQLAQLLAGLQQRKRPFVLVFFSDHLPTFEEPIYAQLPFKDGVDAQTQPVPWAMIKGNAAGEVMPVAVPELAYAWQLPALTLQAAALPRDAYFELTRQVGDQLINQTPAATAILQPGLQAAARARMEQKFDAYAH